MQSNCIQWRAFWMQQNDIYWHPRQASAFTAVFDGGFERSASTCSCSMAEMAVFALSPFFCETPDNDFKIRWKSGPRYFPPCHDALFEINRPLSTLQSARLLQWFRATLQVVLVITRNAGFCINTVRYGRRSVTYQCPSLPVEPSGIASATA